jgi:CheY-like chemotaxis protein
MAQARLPNVLLVDDEPLLLAAASDQLRDEHVRVFEASDASQAVAMLDQSPEIDVLFTDLNLPGGMDGLGLAREVRRTHPHVHLILTSGLWAHAGDEAPEGAIFVQKPYSIDAVAHLVRALVKVG